MRQRGFLSFTMIGVIAAAVVIGGLALALKVQSSRLSSEQTAHAETKGKFQAFVAETKRIGEEAQKKADATRIADQKAKEKADAENKDLRGKLAVAARQLRDYRTGAGRNILPAHKAGSPSPETITFDRAKLDRALQDFIDGTERLAVQGAEGIADLDTAKKWASPAP